MKDESLSSLILFILTNEVYHSPITSKLFKPPSLCFQPFLRIARRTFMLRDHLVFPTVEMVG